MARRLEQRQQDLKVVRRERQQVAWIDGHRRSFPFDGKTLSEDYM
jgi:hypothetical protein